MSKRKFDSNKIVRLHCELCGKPSGKQLKLGEIADKIPDGDKLKGKGASDFGGQKQEFDINGKREKKDK